MALVKEMELDNGVVVNYHRIVSIHHIINHSTIIEIASYTSEDKRKEEKENLVNDDHINVFIHTQYLSIEYTKSMNVDTAYDYLKTLNMFSGARDN